MELQNYYYTKISPESFYQSPEQLKSNVNINTERANKTNIFSKKQKRMLNVLDIFVSTFIVTPLVVGGWRGLWQLMDIYSTHFPVWEGFWMSHISYFIMGLCQKVFHYVIVEKEYKNWLVMRIINTLLMKLYVLVFFIMTIIQWRSGWIIMDRFCGLETTLTGNAIPSSSSTSIWFTIVCTLLLFSIKGFSNVTSPPFTIGLDVEDEIFLYRTRYFTSTEDKTSLYILDCLFSVLIVGTLVVFVWRGAWIIVDILLFPENDVWSAWGSLVIGYAVVAIAFLLQPLMRYLCDRFSGSPRLLLADAFVIFAFFGTVNVWRGIWNLLNIYFLPENPELSCWITHWVCLIILILLGCSNSLLVRGVYIDAEEPAGKCVIFPCYYLRVIFQEDKLKKLHLTNLSFDGNISIQNKIENNHQHNLISTINTNVKDNFTTG